jgi:hypothetical protein
MTAAFIIACVAGESMLWAVDSRGASYFGGTVNKFSGAKDPVEGTLDTTNETYLVFKAGKKPFRDETFSIEYAKIIDLEYGQKAGRRVGAAVATTVLLGPIGLLSLFSKKRKHYLTIGFMDDTDKEQVAVLELGKDTVRTTLAVVQTRSGKQMEYQDDEARKAAK